VSNSDDGNAGGEKTKRWGTRQSKSVSFSLEDPYLSLKTPIHGRGMRVETMSGKKSSNKLSIYPGRTVDGQG